MNEDGTESLLTSDTAKEVYAHLAGPVGLRRRAPVVQGRGRSDLDRPASPRARSALMLYPATLLSSTTGFDVGVAGIPGAERRRVDVRRR